MKRVLTITHISLALASLMLAGCAGDFDMASNVNPCERSMREAQAVTTQLFPLSGLSVPARTLLASGKLDLDDTMTYACIDPKNKTNTVPNLHKIRLDHLSSAI
jgi:hypothetical protein